MGRDHRMTAQDITQEQNPAVRLALLCSHQTDLLAETAAMAAAIDDTMAELVEDGTSQTNVARLAGVSSAKVSQRLARRAARTMR